MDVRAVDADQRLDAALDEVLAGLEDKRNRGASIASPSMPWFWGQEEETVVYHAVWARDLYQVATAQAAAGDTAAANRLLDFLLERQQRDDGSFPQNSDVTGEPKWDNTQMDEVALPIVLAWQLGRTDAWPAVRKAAGLGERVRVTLGSGAPTVVELPNRLGEDPLPSPSITPSGAEETIRTRTADRDICS